MWSVGAPPVTSTSLVKKRFDVLDAVGTRAQRADEPARLLAREEGKPLAEVTGEVLRAAQLFKLFAGEAVRNSGEVLDSVRPGLAVEMTHEPAGVVAAITSGNSGSPSPAPRSANAQSRSGRRAHRTNRREPSLTRPLPTPTPRQWRTQ
jgi:hypothetical protein